MHQEDLTRKLIMKKVINKIVLIVFIITVLIFCINENVNISNKNNILVNNDKKVEAKANTTNEEWKQSYVDILNDMEVLLTIENNDDSLAGQGNYDYMLGYFNFGEYSGFGNFKYDKYLLYDLEKNGIPELLLHSYDTDMTTIITYCENKVKILGTFYNAIINDKGDIIEQGYYHGANSGENQFILYILDNFNYIFSFELFNDFDNGDYCNYFRDDSGTYKIDDLKYDEYYENYISNSFEIKNAKLNDMEDISFIEEY